MLHVYIDDDRYKDEVMDMQGNSDPEGTRRITIEDSDHPPSQICMPSPVFHSAASGLNNQLPSPPPTSDCTGTSFMISPQPERSTTVFTASAPPSKD